MESVFEAQTHTKQATSDMEALHIAKNLLRLVRMKRDSGDELCRLLLEQAMSDAGVRKVGSVRGEPI